jgi:hypothetical protein
LRRAVATPKSVALGIRAENYSMIDCLFARRCVKGITIIFSFFSRFWQGKNYKVLLEIASYRNYKRFRRCARRRRFYAAE